MSPFYPPLPDPVPRSGLMSALGGYAAGQEMQNIALKRQQMQMQMQQQQQMQAALQSGDINSLMKVSPETAMTVQKAKSLQQEEAMAYTYQMADQMKSNPAIIPRVRQRLQQMGVDETMFPENVTPADIDAFKTNYEKMHGIKAGVVPMYDSAGVFKGMIPAESKIANAPTTSLPQVFVTREQAARMGTVPGGAQYHVVPEPTEKTPQWFVDPDKPLSGAWVTPGQSPPVNAAGKAYIPRAETQTALIENMNDEALDTQIRRAIQTGTDPSMGFGAALRKRYMERFPIVMKQMGLGVGDVAAQKVKFAALKTAAGQMDAQAVKIEAFANTFDKNIDVLENLVAKKDPRTGVPILNKWIQAGKRSVTGDPDISALDVAVKTVANEFARLTTTATGGGMLAEEEIKKAEGLLAAAQTPEQMRSALSVMKKDRQNRVKSFQEQRDIIKKQAQEIPGTASGGGTKQTFNSMPNASLYSGKKMTDTTTGTKYRSDGTNWIPVTE